MTVLKLVRKNRWKKFRTNARDFRWTSDDSDWQPVRWLGWFCTGGIDFSCLSVDTMFHIRNFSVTLTSYWNLLLKSCRTGKSPFFIGPIFMHHTKQWATYKQFFDKLTSIWGQLSNVICYRTDGEKALSDALAKAFRKLPSLPMDGRTLPNGKIMHECQCLHFALRLAWGICQWSSTQWLQEH